MMSAKSLAAYFIVIPLFGTFSLAARPAEELGPTADQFDQLRALIKPRPGEDKWAEIPWMASLWEARQRAATLGKPILLWEMDGNPLGCG